MEFRGIAKCYPWVIFKRHNKEDISVVEELMWKQLEKETIAVMTSYKSEDRALKKGEEFKLSPSRSQEEGEVCVYVWVTSELRLLLMN